jgi:short-subunit dehydrogenase
MPLGLLVEQAPAQIHKIMAINYGGLVNVAHAALPRLLARGRGEFVSYASLAGLMPTIYMGAYNASKFAVVAFTEVLYNENYGRGVKFACVCPPPVATPLLQQARDTIWPPLLDISPPITAEAVVEAVERGLVKGTFWIFPGPLTRLFWRLRRWMPGPLWWFVRRYRRREERRPATR